MLHIEDKDIREHIFDGCFGLEKEGLRVLENGRFSHSPHPFGGDKNIGRDFCENQTEINTSVNNSAEEAVEELLAHTLKIRKTLASLPEKEYFWPFSNPPYIRNELDIPIASFTGGDEQKTRYREYLSSKYGRYKMTFSGIHVNYSFSDELLRLNKERYGGDEDFQTYKNALYLDLAKKMAAHGWILVALTAASPLLDSSYFEKDTYDTDVFTGMASVRSSEMGYWNEFTPIFNYTDIEKYTDCINAYVTDGALMQPSELYYPVRVKPAGAYDMDALKKDGIDHIELRMFDLNPLAEAGLDIRDVLFSQLLLVCYACLPEEPFELKDQVHAVQNFKNAARYDLKTVHMMRPDGENITFVQAGLRLIDGMRDFFNKHGIDVNDILDFEYAKFTNPENRYAWQVRRKFANSFVKKGLEFVKNL